MALQEQTTQLVNKLSQLSAQGKVVWQETADENTFLASVAKFVVTIAKISDDFYTFTIADQTGKTLEEVREDSGYPNHDFKRLAELHEVARRAALNVEGALSEMLTSLEQIH
jgi:polyphosphate kinase